MANTRALSIGLGVAQGLEKASASILNIVVAKERLGREREMFDIKKKQAKLALKEAEFNLSPEALSIVRDKQKTEIELKEADLKLKKAKVDEAAIEAKNQMTLGVLSGQKNLSQLSPERAASIASPIAEPGTSFVSTTPEQDIIATEDLRRTLGISQEEAARQSLGVSKSRGSASVRSGMDKATLNELDDFVNAPSKAIALESLDEDEEFLRAKGINVDFIRKQLELLPDEVEESEQSTFNNLLSRAKETPVVRGAVGLLDLIKGKR